MQEFFTPKRTKAALLPQRIPDCGFFYKPFRPNDLAGVFCTIFLNRLVGLQNEPNVGSLVGFS